jgi:hypothetical protein
MRGGWGRAREREPWPASLRVTASALLAMCVALGTAAAQTQASPEAKGLRTVGAIKAVNNGTITVTSDSGEEVTATLQADTKILRVAPGQKDLKGATPLRVEDLQSGDRVLVRGLPLFDAKTLKAVSVIVMKQTDVASKQGQDREDWQKRGVGGLVTSVDAAAGTITISLGAAGGPGAAGKTITVRTTPTTVLRRYAPNSIKFDDAKPAPITEIKSGDQLRARGARSADGSELAADEIISGSFRNIAGTIQAKDEGATTITVQDVLTKKSVMVKVAGDSTVKALPPEMAQRIAMRLKGAGSGANANGGPPGGGMQPTAAGSGGSPSRGQGEGRPAGGWSGAGGASGSGPPDLQRFLSRLPSKALSDLNKGDAVMIVATQSSDGSAVTAITLLAGVEPILTAAPNGGSNLSSWTLGSSVSEGGPQ